MKVMINGENQNTDAANVRSLIESMGLGEHLVAVELNGEVVPRRDHLDTLLQEGDRLEIVTLVGGG